MAIIPRKFQKVFGGSLVAPGNIGQFGSGAAGSPAYSLDPDQIQSLAAFLNGWAAALINAPGGLASPALQDMNALFFLITRQLAYLFQAGIAEWDTTTVYYTGSWCMSAGVAYISKTDNNAGNPVSDTNNWKTLQSTLQAGTGICKAWVTFNGQGGLGAQTIYSAFNISGVSKTATGAYVLTFQNAMADANYAFSGSCGTPNGSSPAAGDNNIVAGGAPGRTIIKTTNQLTIFTWEPNGGGLEDSSSISVLVFGNP